MDHLTNRELGESESSPFFCLEFMVLARRAWRESSMLDLSHKAASNNAQGRKLYAIA